VEITLYSDNRGNRRLDTDSSFIPPLNAKMGSS
jgi:hypothetical protein